MAVTISDVAKEVGVSTTTVSAVLNNRPNFKSSTRLKVLEAIGKLGYVPSQAARDLVRQDRKRFGEKRTGNIGIIYLKSSVDELFSDNPFYYAVFEGISAETESSNMGLLFASVEDLGDSLSVPKMIRDRQVDGLILIGNIEGNAPIIHRLRKKFPVLLVSRYIRGEDFECVVADNMGGARKAVNHLAGSGCADIGFLCPSLSNTCYQERYLSYKATLEELGLPVQDELIEVHCDDAGSCIPVYIQKIRSRSFKAPVGVFAANDVIAMKTIKAAREAGFEIPRELGVCGFDDLPIGVEISPSLTTIRVPKVIMGRTAVQKLSEMISKKKQFQGRTVLPVELVERESSRARDGLEEAV